MKSKTNINGILGTRGATKQNPMKQLDLFRSKGKMTGMPFKSASRLLVFVMMLLATLQVKAQEKEVKMYIVKDGDVATFYYDGLYDEWRKKDVTVILDMRLLYYYSYITKVVFDVSFSNARPTSTNSWFTQCEQLKEITGMENLNTSNVTSMNSMFYDCSNLTNLDVSHFDTGNVTDMSLMFSGCSSLTSLDVSNFNTTNVTDMSVMFQNCSNLTNLDVSKFNTSNVTDMSLMFSHCEALTNLDVSKFNTSNVTDMSLMFSHCEALTNLDVSKFNTSSVTDMSGMFQRCNRLTNLDVSKFDTRKVTDMRYMFSACSGLTDLDVSKFNTSNVTHMEWMFQNCEALKYIDVSNFNTSKVTSMGYMFSVCRGLTSLDVSNFDTGNVTSMSNMFQSCDALTSLDISNFNTEKVTNMSRMLYNCNKLTHINLSNFVTNNTTNMDDMLDGLAPSLESVIIGENMMQIPSFARSNKINKIVSYLKEPYAIASTYFKDNVKENAKLYVPNSTRTLYTNTDGWKEFKHIVAKDLEPNDGGNSGTGGNIPDDTDINGNIINNMFFNVPAEAGEYDVEEGCIILRKNTTDEQVNNIIGLDMFDEYLLNNFTGVIFMIEAGSGTIELEAETTGEMLLNVKIGETEPTTKQVIGKSNVSIPYDVAVPTMVYIYAGMPQTYGAKGMTRADSDDGVLKIYSILWGKAAGISSIYDENDSKTTIYNLKGQRINTPVRGVYIVNGKKVIVK